MLTALCLAAAVLALLPAGLSFWNLAVFAPPLRDAPPGLAVSVVIPARDEAANIGACLDAALASVGCALEVVVVDDHSTDATPAIVAARQAADPRLRLIVPPALPAGWAGKPHACQAGAGAARHPILLFIDADVRLEPDAAARLAGALAAGRLALLSGFPRERAESLGEILLVPLIHVLLMGYLPIALMRRRRDVGLAAGCGQLMMADAAAYAGVGGHGAVRATWHDGVTLPRAFRAAGRATGLVDATGLAACRMYEGFTQTWRGFSKNAREGLARPAALPLWTVLLGGGFVLPWLLALLALAIRLPRGPLLAMLASLAILLGARFAVARRFRQPTASVWLTPVGMAMMLVLQWRALLARRGGAVAWRGRIQTV